MPHLPTNTYRIHKETSTAMATRKSTTTTTPDVNVPQHPLAHLIPDEWFANDYHGRKVGGVDDYDVLDTAFDLRHNVLLEGPTGSAKTSLVYAWAAKRGLPVVNIPCNGAAEPRSLFGGWVAQQDGSLAFVRGDLYLAVQYGGVAYFDEVNMMPPRIASVVHGLFDKRRTLTVLDAAGSAHPTTVVAHKDFFIVGAYNPGYTDTFDLNEAFKNRFAFKLVWNYDRNVEAKMIESHKLLDFAEALRKRVEDGTLRTPVATNMLIEFETFYARSNLGFGFAVEMFLNAFHSDERPIVKETLLAYQDDILAELSNIDFE